MTLYMSILQNPSWWKEGGCCAGAEPARRRCTADRAWWEVKCGCEDVHTSLYHVHTYTNIHEHVCTMYIHIYIFINVYVPCTYNYRYACTCTYTFLWKFVTACTCTYHVCTWFRHVCTGLTYLRQVGRIPDESGLSWSPTDFLKTVYKRVCQVLEQVYTIFIDVYTRKCENATGKLPTWRSHS